MSTQRNTPQTDPLDLAETFAESKGWESTFDKEREDVMYIALPGRYKTSTLQIQWAEQEEMLLLHINFEMPMIPYFAVGEFNRLLNLMNAACLIGTWFSQFCEGIGEVLIWRHVVHTDQSLLDVSNMNNLILQSQRMHDSFYPVFTSFFGAKPKMVEMDGELQCIGLGMSPEQAMSFADDSRSFGRA